MQLGRGRIMGYQGYPQAQGLMGYFGWCVGSMGPYPLPSATQLPLHPQPSPASPAAPTLLSPGAGAPGLGQTSQGRGPELHPSAGPRRSRSGQEPTADGQDEAGVRTEVEGMGGG